MNFESREGERKYELLVSSYINGTLSFSQESDFIQTLSENKNLSNLYTLR